MQKNPVAGSAIIISHYGFNIASQTFIVCIVGSFMDLFGFPEIFIYF